MNLKAKILNNLSEWRIDRSDNITNIKNFENLFGNESPYVLFCASEVDETKGYLTEKDKKDIKKAMILVIKNNPSVWKIEKIYLQLGIYGVDWTPKIVNLKKDEHGAPSDGEYYEELILNNRPITSYYYNDYWKLAFGERASFKSGFAEEEWKEIAEIINTQNSSESPIPNSGWSSGKIILVIGGIIIFGLSIILFVKKKSAKSKKKK